MASNTQTGEGIRLAFVSLGYRNFENDQSGLEFSPVQYKSAREGLYFLGTSYHAGATLPFDAGGASYYGPHALAELQLFWNQGWITPLT